MGDFVLKIEAPSAKKRDTIRAAPTDYAGELLKLLLKKVRSSCVRAIACVGRGASGLLNVLPFP